MKIYVISPNLDWEEVEERFGTPVSQLDEKECETLYKECCKKSSYDVTLYDRLDEFEMAFNNGEISDEGFIRMFND